MSDTLTRSASTVDIDYELDKHRSRLEGKDHGREYEFHYIVFHVLFEWPKGCLLGWLRDYGVPLPALRTRTRIERAVFDKAFPDE